MPASPPNRSELSDSQRSDSQRSDSQRSDSQGRSSRSADETGAQTAKQRIDRALGSLVPSIEAALEKACQFDSGCPIHLADAIRYALLAPGKRLRPALVLMAAEACGGSIESAMPGAVAVEMIHAYSLIHDDLPAMDDDDLRRGQPTVHIAFDEATAILAGDALQPLAFAHLCQNVPDQLRAAQAVSVLANAAGPEHLVGGQADDLAAESGQLPPHVAESLTPKNSVCEPDDASKRTQSVPRPQPASNRSTETNIHSSETNGVALGFLESIHRRKTGALFAASLDLGAVLCGASDRQRQSLAAYASDIGLAFQVVDDLLDHTADASQLGKRTQKDSERGKLTYPGLMGIDHARRFAEDLVKSAQGHTAVFGSTAWRLNELADYVLSRTH